jgi:lipopolysaccharide/colanic/teichoic acid biosynthesis glycosyltransferase
MHRYVLLSIDLLLIAASTVSALILRDNLEISSVRMLAIFPYLLLTLLAAVPVLLLAGLNRTLWRFSSFNDIARVSVVVVATVLLAMALSFIFNRMENVARSLPILQGLLMLIALVSVRVAMRVRHAARNGPRNDLLRRETPQEGVLIVGVNTVSELFLRSVEEYAGDRIKVFGILGRSERQRDRLLGSCPILGKPEELEKVLADLEVHGVQIDRIVITTTFDQLTQAAQAILLHVEKSSNIVLDFFAERIVCNGKVSADRNSSERPNGNGQPTDALYFVDPEIRAPGTYMRLKRSLDATAAGLGILCLSPVLLIIFVAVALDSGFPVVFWQQRPGLRGWPFKLYKFRTMRPPHDSRGRLLSEAERQSRLGRFLRRIRLDELPQLYNILVGDMSFVGPRPLLPVDQSPAFAARLAVRPGLTGWAQIKGGRELTASDKAALDIWYVKNASLRLDLRILFGTVAVVYRGEETDRNSIRQAWRELRSCGMPHVHDKLTLDDDGTHLHKALGGEYARVARVREALRANPLAQKRA